MWLECIGVVSGCYVDFIKILLTISLLHLYNIALFCSSIPTLFIFNPRHACAARVTVVVLCVCMYVSTHIYRFTHWNHKREIPTVHSNTGIVLNFADFPKNNASFKSYGIIIMSSSDILALFPHGISFYASLKPIATFSLHRQWAFEDRWSMC